MGLTRIFSRLINFQNVINFSACSRRFSFLLIIGVKMIKLIRLKVKFFFQETTERLIEAKQRVAHKKAKSEKVQAFYPLPYSTVTPFTSSATEQMLKYEGNIV